MRRVRIFCDLFFHNFAKGAGFCTALWVFIKLLQYEGVVR